MSGTQQPGICAFYGELEIVYSALKQNFWGMVIFSYKLKGLWASKLGWLATWWRCRVINVSLNKKLHQVPQSWWKETEKQELPCRWRPYCFLSENLVNYMLHLSTLAESGSACEVFTLLWDHVGLPKPAPPITPWVDRRVGKFITVPGDPNTHQKHFLVGSSCTWPGWTHNRCSTTPNWVHRPINSFSTLLCSTVSLGKK